MYNLGQTLWDKENKELVLYVGIDNNWKVWIKNSSGKIEKLDTFDRFIHIADKNGKPVPGKHAIHAYFGRLWYKDYRKMKPDTDIFPDNLNYFRGDQKPDLNPRYEVFCPK